MMTLSSLAGETVSALERSVVVPVHFRMGKRSVEDHLEFAEYF
jgi:hypothetical protein